MPTKLTPEIITAAILGFEEQKRHIDTKLAELRAMLSGGLIEPATTPEAAPRKRPVVAFRSDHDLVIAVSVLQGECQFVIAPHVYAWEALKNAKEHSGGRGRKHERSEPG